MMDKDGMCWVTMVGDGQGWKKLDKNSVCWERMVGVTCWLRKGCVV